MAEIKHFPTTQWMKALIKMFADSGARLVSLAEGPESEDVVISFECPFAPRQVNTVRLGTTETVALFVDKFAKLFLVTLAKEYRGDIQIEFNGQKMWLSEALRSLLPAQPEQA